MSKYSVMLEGSEIEIESAEGGDAIRGFFVVKVVNAASASDAVQRAKEEVRKDWATGQHSIHKADPILKIEQVDRLSFFRSFRAKSTGYMFHPGDDE